LKKLKKLIDEYDVPIQSGYLNNYYDSIIEFMRNFLSGALKDNEHLEKAVMTGILMVAKESIFSGLNNLNVYGILRNKYSSYFGFSETEIEEIFKYYSIDFKLDEVKTWYNGYVFGNNIIYNPWSILSYAQNYEEGLQPYWINTSSNDLVKKLITKSNLFSILSNLLLISPYILVSKSNTLSFSICSHSYLILYYHFHLVSIILAIFLTIKFLREKGIYSSYMQPSL
jgi:hypothetical protein